MPRFFENVLFYFRGLALSNLQTADFLKAALESIRHPRFHFACIAMKIFWCGCKISICRGKWCPETDLNRRHRDFQSLALPTELSGHLFANTQIYAGECLIRFPKRVVQPLVRLKIIYKHQVVMRLIFLAKTLITRPRSCPRFTINPVVVMMEKAP